MKLLLAVMTLLSFAAPLSAQDFPQPIGHVNDFADVLSSSEEETLEVRLRAYEVSSSNEIAVVTIQSLEGYVIEDYAQRLGEEWGVGKEEKDNGIVFLVAIEDREMSIEVGYGLEPFITDTDAKRIIDRTVTPQFRDGDFSGGISEGVEEIIARIDESAVSEAGGEELASPAYSREEESGGVSPLTVVLIVLVVLVVFGVVAAIVASEASSGGGGSDVLILPPMTTSSTRSRAQRRTSNTSYKRSSNNNDDDDDGPSFGGGILGGGIGGGGTGGFSGFGGGSFGGGGASGKW